MLLPFLICYNNEWMNEWILWNSMTSTSFVFTELANLMKYGGEFLYNLVFTEWRHCVSQNEVWGRGCYITFFSPSDVTAFHRISIMTSIAPVSLNNNETQVEGIHVEYIFELISFGSFLNYIPDIQDSGPWERPIHRFFVYSTQIE